MRVVCLFVCVRVRVIGLDWFDCAGHICRDSQWVSCICLIDVNRAFDVDLFHTYRSLSLLTDLAYRMRICVYDTHDAILSRIVSR